MSSVREIDFGSLPNVLLTIVAEYVANSRVRERITHKYICENDLQDVPSEYHGRRYLPYLFDSLAVESFTIPPILSMFGAIGVDQSWIIHRLYTYAAREFDIHIIEMIHAQYPWYSLDKHADMNDMPHTIMPFNEKMLNYKYGPVVHIGRYASVALIEFAAELFGLDIFTIISEMTVGAARAGDIMVLRMLIKLGESNTLPPSLQRYKPGKNILSSGILRTSAIIGASYADRATFKYVINTLYKSPNKIALNTLIHVLANESRDNTCDIFEYILGGPSACRLTQANLMHIIPYAAHAGNLNVIRMIHGRHAGIFIASARKMVDISIIYSSDGKICSYISDYRHEGKINLHGHTIATRAHAKINRDLLEDHLLPDAAYVRVLVPTAHCPYCGILTFHHHQFHQKYGMIINGDIPAQLRAVNTKHVPFMYWLLKAIHETRDVAGYNISVDNNINTIKLLILNRSYKPVARICIGDKNHKSKNKSSGEDYYIARMRMRNAISDARLKHLGLLLC